MAAGHGSCFKSHMRRGSLMKILMQSLIVFGLVFYLFPQSAVAAATTQYPYSTVAPSPSPIPVTTSATFSNLSGISFTQDESMSGALSITEWQFSPLYVGFTSAKVSSFEFQYASTNNDPTGTREPIAAFFGVTSCRPSTRAQLIQVLGSRFNPRPGTIYSYQPAKVLKGAGPTYKPYGMTVQLICTRIDDITFYFGDGFDYSTAIVNLTLMQGTTHDEVNGSVALLSPTQPPIQDILDGFVGAGAPNHSIQLVVTRPKS